MSSHVISAWPGTWSVYDQPCDQCMIATWSVHDQLRYHCMISHVTVHVSNLIIAGLPTWAPHETHVISAWSATWAVYDQPRDQCMISCLEPVYIRKLSLGDSEGQGSLTGCSPWGPKESDTTERLNNKTRKQSLNSRITTSFYIKIFLWCVITKGCWKCCGTRKVKEIRFFLCQNTWEKSCYVLHQW